MHYIFYQLGTGGRFLLILIAMVVALGAYKFVKDWLPW